MLIRVKQRRYRRHSQRLKKDIIHLLKSTILKLPSLRRKEILLHLNLMVLNRKYASLSNQFESFKPSWIHKSKRSSLLKSKFD